MQGEKMYLKELKRKKENADWLWNTVFEKAKKGEATQAELVMAMDLCNQVEKTIMKVEHRQQADIFEKKSENLHKYFKGFSWYRIEDNKLFISNGEKFISQTLPYEAISFDQMDKIND
jgi:hypothetical protein